MKEKMISTQYISKIAMLTAMCVVLRQVFLWIPNVQPITALFLVFTIYSSVKDTLLVMTLSLFITGMFNGFGLWIGAQILIYAILIICWAFLHKKITNFFMQLVIVGGLTLFYGFGVSFLTAPFFGAKNFWAFYLQGINFDLMHVVATIISYPLILEAFKFKPINKFQKIGRGNF
jgi:hypothetical protein